MWLGLRLRGAGLLFALATTACGLDASGTGFATLDGGHDVVPIPIDAAPDGSLDGGTSRAALVSAGTVSSSKSYEVIGTLGQGPSSNAVMRSPSFTFTGGIVGATQRK